MLLANHGNDIDPGPGEALRFVAAGRLDRPTPRTPDAPTPELAGRSNTAGMRCPSWRCRRARPRTPETPGLIPVARRSSMHDHGAHDGWVHRSTPGTVDDGSLVADLTCRDDTSAKPAPGLTRSTRGATPMPRISSRGQCRRAGAQSVGTRRVLRRPARSGHPPKLRSPIHHRPPDTRNGHCQHRVARASGSTIKSDPARSSSPTRVSRVDINPLAAVVWCRGRPSASRWSLITLLRCLGVHLRAISHVKRRGRCSRPTDDSAESDRGDDDRFDGWRPSAARRPLLRRDSRRLPTQSVILSRPRARAITSPRGHGFSFPWGAPRPLMDRRALLRPAHRCPELRRALTGQGLSARETPRGGRNRLPPGHSPARLASGSLAPDRGRGEADRTPPCSHTLRDLMKAPGRLPPPISTVGQRTGDRGSLKLHVIGSSRSAASARSWAWSRRSSSRSRAAAEISPAVSARPT